MKFGQPVVYQAREELDRGDLPYIEIEALDVERDRARLVFRYAVEGLLGRGSFVRKAGAWELDELELVRRTDSEEGPPGPRVGDRLPRLDAARPEIH